MKRDVDLLRIFLCAAGATSLGVSLGDSLRVPFRKAYLQPIIDVVEVDDHRIRIKGSKDVLERAVLAGQAMGESGSQMSTRWRARRDSNSRSPDSSSGAHWDGVSCHQVFELD